MIRRIRSVEPLLPLLEELAGAQDTHAPTTRLRLRDFAMRVIALKLCSESVTGGATLDAYLTGVELPSAAEAQLRFDWRFPMVLFKQAGDLCEEVATAALGEGDLDLRRLAAHRPYPGDALDVGSAISDWLRLFGAARTRTLGDAQSNELSLALDDGLYALGFAKFNYAQAALLRGLAVQGLGESWAASASFFSEDAGWAELVLSVAKTGLAIGAGVLSGEARTAGTRILPILQRERAELLRAVKEWRQGRT